MAIMAIIALGVGFFSGLKVCKEVMLATGDKYLESVNFFDFEGISTLGFDESSPEEIEKNSAVTEAEGSITIDLMFDYMDNKELVFNTMSIPEKINTPDITAGRMPEAANECMVDDMWLDIDSMLGKTITVSEANDEDTLELMSKKEFTIVGTCRSPLHLNYERGTTSIGNGMVSGFIYLPEDAFDMDYYTRIYVTVGEYLPIYSDEYESKIDNTEKEIEKLFKEEANKRYDNLFAEYEEEYNKEVADKRQETIDKAIADAGDLSAYGPMADSIKEKIEKEAGEAFDEEVGEMPDPPFEKPKVYNLDRESNVGYVCYDSDTSIIDSIAKVFPIFFFLVAALVCMTTMTRMVDEQRTQMGVLKAMGYENSSILSTYLFYSGSASLIGGVIGFLIGAYLFPYVIWKAYTMMYDFSDSAEFVINWKLGLATIGVALLCTMGATIISCISDTREVPAQLIRPKAPEPGKRILLERIDSIWKRISFLYKVSLRNIFRYHKRFLMMIMGISGCTALLVAGFGINDSISHIADYQYSEISLYDYSVVLEDDLTDKDYKELEKAFKDEGKATDIVFCEQISMNFKGIAGNPLRLIATDFQDFDKFIKLHYHNEPLDPPGEGEIIICESFAIRHNLEVGDTIHLQDDDMEEASFVVSGICENYIYNYGYVTPETFEKSVGRPAKKNTAFVLTSVPKDEDHFETLNKVAADVRDIDNVTSVALADEFRQRISNMLNSLNAIVYVVVASAGALAFIVIYNLTNINITERIREIATIKVLGFYNKETAAYVFRENLFLTAIGSAIGLFLGNLLLIYIIRAIKVDMIFFPVRITSISIVLSICLTFAFAAIVMFFLYFKLNKVNMAESLKTIE